MSLSPAWLAADWPNPPGVIAGCTLRFGGSSHGKFASMNLGHHVGDDSDAVAANRREFAALCALPSEPVWLNQVHGNNVVVDPAEELTAPADAIVSRDDNAVCAVLTADCLPVVIASKDGREIGVAHAGWRGLVAGVIENTIRQFSMAAHDLQCWLGPAISQVAFEVGDEVWEAFTDGEPGAEGCFVYNDRGRWQADLYGLARQRLQALGIEAIYGGEYCTFSDSERFFSYRRDGQCGRMASFIFRADSGSS